MMMATPRAASTSQNLSTFCPTLRSVPGSSPVFRIIPHPWPPPHGLGLVCEYGLHHQARTQGGRSRGGTAVDAERRGAYIPRPGLRDLTGRREDDAALSGRRCEQRLLFPLRGCSRRPDGGLYLGRAASGLPGLPPEDVGLRRRCFRRTRVP